MPAIDIIFEDGDVLIANKPAGLGTQAPIAFDSFEARIRAYLAEKAEPGETPYLGIPHRLDRCVSGAMIFAKRKQAARLLSQQFERREVEKGYVAIVAGAVEPKEDEWRDFIRKIPDEPRAEIVVEDAAKEASDAKEAILQYVVTTALPGESTDVAVAESAESTVLPMGHRSQLKVRLVTGRMHQIRIQCASRGYPVIGDKMYGSEFQFGPEPKHERDRQIALHAVEIEFEHPRVNERMKFTAPFPKNWPTA